MKDPQPLTHCPTLPPDLEVIYCKSYVSAVVVMYECLHSSDQSYEGSLSFFVIFIVIPALIRDLLLGGRRGYCMHCAGTIRIETSVGWEHFKLTVV